MAHTGNYTYSTLRGERAAIGGYLPQYDEFAIGVYEAMNAGDLEEIRVADVEENVGKLDDIVYVTSRDVFAYQVKWSTTGDTISYLDFKTLLPGIVKGWRLLKSLYPDKIVRPKLLTNKSLTEKDHSIRSLFKNAVGGFSAFEKEVLRNLKNGSAIDQQWGTAVEDLRRDSSLNETEWEAFWSVFTFTYGYEQEQIKVKDAEKDQRISDILRINRLIQEYVARPGINNPITEREIIIHLGWLNRFQTIFEHNLIVPQDSYVPNSSGITQLDKCLTGKTKGYLFLKGSPGSGKSTLLTQWTRGLANPSVRFYAFDFLNPSSQRNNESSRGSGITFLNDIVLQIYDAGIEKNRELPPLKDFNSLKKRFYEQLSAISNNFQETRTPFLIVVDGLDHITREYKDCAYTLLSVLPSPSDLPDGVVFVLGSQHFDHLNLNLEIEREAKDEANLVEMPPLSKVETEELCRKLLGPGLITEKVLDICWRKSQGHPLYLRYLLNRIINDGESILASVEDSPEGVEEYYGRIIGHLLEESAALNESLGLISRITGVMKLNDVRSLCEKDSLLVIKNKLWHLFNYDKQGQELSFFHNSFRQYLLDKTATDTLKGDYVKEIDIAYYKKLAEHFRSDWGWGYYLYKAGDYEQFVKEITPDYLFAQAQNYRPIWSIRRDMENGVEIARQKKDPYLLIRFLLLENQLSQMEHQDYSVFSLIKEFIHTGRGALAKAIIREGRILHCSQEFAMDIAIEFLKSGDKEESAELFGLTYPDFLSRGYDESNHFHHDISAKKNILESWVRTAGYFLNWNVIEQKIDRFVSYLETYAAKNNDKYDKERVKRRFINVFLDSLSRQGRWEDLTEMICHLEEDAGNLPIIFRALDFAIEYLSENEGRIDLLQQFFHKAKSVFSKLESQNVGYLRMAYLALKSKQPDDEVKKCIDRVEWKELGSFYQSDTGQGFDTLSAHLFYLKTRARCGFNDNLLELVPDDDSHEDNELMVNYARMVFSIAQMAGRVLGGHRDSSFLPHIKYSIRSFDSFSSPVPYNRYSYTLSRQRGDFYVFAVESAAEFGEQMLEDVAKAFESYFSDGTCKADADSRRMAILSFYREGFDGDWCKEQLEKIDGSMMQWQDVDGREREALRQGCAWLEVGSPKKAELFFHRLIEETFGVGYRKDYQPTLFAEWIGDAVENNPKDAIQYIHWLTSRFKHIETIAESRTCLRAAEKLLKETLSFNMGAGLKLAIWLLDSEYDYFQSVSSALLMALLSAAQQKDEFQALFRYYVTIHLYTDDYAPSFDLNTDVLEAVVECGKRVLGNDFRTVISRMKKGIETECPERISDSLMTALDKTLSGSVKENKRSQRERDKVIADTNSLLQDGRKEEAWTKAMEALDASSPSGWARYYDGGSRIDAVSLLQKIDEERGRKITVDLFANDILTGYSYGTIHYLDEITPLLTKHVDKTRLLEEEFSYMNRILRADVVCDGDKPDISPKDSNVCEIIRDWLLYLAKLPVVCVMERAKLLLAHLCDESLVDLIGAMDNDNSAERIILEVGCYLVELGSSRLSDFKEIALKSAISENYQFRVYASKILRRLDAKIPEAPYKPLPATYSIVFAETTERPLDWLKDKDHVSDINWRDSSSIMSVASHLCGYLAHCSGIDKRTLNYRAVELMKQYGDATEANMKKDKEISRHFDAIGLRYSYKKAHSQSALDGMLAVAAELKDGGAINGNYLDFVFLSCDFRSILVEAQIKPDFIQRIADPDSWSADKNWIDESKKSPRLSDGIALYNGCCVIGEYSRIKKMEDKLPYEEYQAKLSFDEVGINDPPANSFFGESPFMRESSDYLELGWDDPEVILLRGGYYMDFSNKSHWIAFNPALAILLGLRPSVNGYFAWENERGVKVVESIYWQSGNISGASSDRYEASEGWMVVATKEIVDLIRSRNQVFLHKMVLRRYEGNLSDMSHRAYFVKKIESLNWNM